MGRSIAPNRPRRSATLVVRRRAETYAERGSQAKMRVRFPSPALSEPAPRPLSGEDNLEPPKCRAHSRVTGLRRSGGVRCGNKIHELARPGGDQLQDITERPIGAGANHSIAACEVPANCASQTSPDPAAPPPPSYAHARRAHEAGPVCPVDAPHPSMRQPARDTRSAGALTFSATPAATPPLTVRTGGMRPRWRSPWP